MDDLIIRVLNNLASSFEEERLNRWRGESPENEALFQETAQVWRLTAPEPVVPSSGPPSVEDILAAAPISFDRRPTPDKTERSILSGRWMRWGLLAASIAAVGFGLQIMGDRSPQPSSVYSAPDGRNLTVMLNDGSYVRLASGATLREWELEGHRQVSLDGRAFFAVARDESHPFVVRTEAGEVRVLGTRFQVDAQENEVETVVVEGLVRVSNDLGSSEAPAGTVTRMKTDAPPVSEEAGDLFAYLDWPQGVLIFQATPLAHVAEEVSRHFGRTIRIEGGDLAQRRVTAWFEGETFEAVAESICLVTEAECRVEGEAIAMDIGGNGRTR